MIYTLTCNPSLDLVVSLPRLSPGTVNRAAGEQVYPGGKGINVSLMLTHLGLPNHMLGFTAGFTGRELVRLLHAQGCTPDFIELPEGCTRINLKLRAQEETEINGAGPAIPPRALADLNDRLDGLHSGDYLVLSGSIPPSLQDDLYETVLRRMKGRGVHCVVDASGTLLRRTLPYAPFLIKPNQHELGELFQVRLHAIEDVAFHAKRLQGFGARNVLVSMGQEGAVLLTEQGESLCIPAPEGELMGSTGAGDSMVAGFLAGWIKTGAYQPALEWAVCAGSATAYSEWLASREAVQALLRQYQGEGELL